MKIQFLNLFCVFMIILSFSLPSLASENEVTSDYFSSEKTKQMSVFTPEYEALSAEEKQKIRDAESKWYEDHTFNVTAITTYQSTLVDFNSVNSNAVLTSSNSTLSNNSKIIKLEVQETYYSEELRFIEMFGSKSVSDTSEFFIDPNIKYVSLERTSIQLDQELSKTVLDQKTIVMTPRSDPYIWSAYGYSHPAHLWKLKDGNYQEADPINLIWEDTSLSNVRNRILSAQPSWEGNNILIMEYNYTLWDATNQTHITSQSIVSSFTRAEGGYHVRLYGFQGNVYGAAHQDSPVFQGLTYTGHQIVNFESVESLVAGCFANNNWYVYPNNLSLINGKYYAQEYGYPSVYNNGDATLIEPR